MAASSFFRITLRKKRMAACFSNSRAASRLPLLSNSIASLTLLSARVSSLRERNSPSTRNSKSSNFKLTTALPRLSATDAGMGTRFEVMRTTSLESISSPVLFTVMPAPGRLGSAPGRVGFGVLFGSCRLPDWPSAGGAEQRQHTIRRTSKWLNRPAPFLVGDDFARATLTILSRPIQLAVPGVPAFYELCAVRVREEEVKAQR